MTLPKPDLCRSCVGWEWECPSQGQGFILPSGTGSNGVCIVGEAAGEGESLAGSPFVGKSGETLDKLLSRGGLNRDDFKVYNVLACRPPDNKLVGMWYMDDVINHCRPHLDAVLREAQPKCIVTLGVTAFKRILPEIASQWGVGLLDSKKHKGARGYTFWSAIYNCWVVPTVHPAFAIRGKSAWLQVILHDCQRAVEIARDGYTYDEVIYTLDPAPIDALKWVAEFEEAYRVDPTLILSCDIETPEKDANEEELEIEETQDYIILRCGYSYKDRHGLSIPWGGSYRLVHERLLGHPCDKVFWNAPFDVPRILADE